MVDIPAEVMEIMNAKGTVKALVTANKAAFMIAAGPKAYEIQVENPVRYDNGEALAAMNEGLAAVNLHAKALWMFDVVAVYDEGAGPNAGTKIA